MDNIKIVKLVNGEEILGKVKETEDQNGKLIMVSIEKPAVLIPAGKNQLAIVNYMPYGRVPPDGLKIEANKIMFILIAEEGIAKDYFEATTGLVTGPIPSLKLSV